MGMSVGSDTEQPRLTFPCPVGGAEGTVLAHACDASEGRLTHVRGMSCSDILCDYLWLTVSRHEPEGAGAQYHRRAEGSEWTRYLFGHCLVLWVQVDGLTEGTSAGRHSPRPLSQSSRHI